MVSTDSGHLQFLRKMRPIQFFFLVTYTSIAFSLFLLQLASRLVQPATNENLIQDAFKNIGRDYKYKDVYKKTITVRKDLKYILLWTRDDYNPFYYLGKGQRAFVKNNCSVIKCYVTTNRKLFGGDLTKFDAIAFNGRNLNASDLPSARSRHQQYIFVITESADYFPVCETLFDGFFNWTLTFRLYSDIPYPFILIRDNKGEIVGPKRKMRWKEDIMATVYDELVDRNRIENKTEAAAWLVSNCYARSDRQNYVKELMNALEPYGFTVDIYGKCGTNNCPKKSSNCQNLFKNHYFFYMAMENSFDEDYATEKLLTALQYDVVPVVYGGADYTRFLPPGSYIDCRKHNVTELAAMMNRLIHSPKEYSLYFRWKHHYTYHDPRAAENVCAVCEALHNKKMLQKTKIYHDFRRWWNPNFETRCRSIVSKSKQFGGNKFLVFITFIFIQTIFGLY